jgi:hypothetical protein
LKSGNLPPLATNEPQDPSIKAKRQESDPFEEIKSIPWSGFDPEGELEIRVLANGNLYVVFNFMPPLSALTENEDKQGLGSYENFDKEVSEAIGLPVL